MLTFPEMQHMANSLGKEGVQASCEVILDSRSIVKRADPDVSLIIPVYNVRDYVGECLLSVLSNCHLISLEIIIIDDGSTDDSAVEISSLLRGRQDVQALFIRQDNQGLSAVRNLGAKLARGRYLAFLDSDDFQMAGSLCKLYGFAQRQACEVALARSLVYDAKTQHAFPFYDQWVWDRLLGRAQVRVISRLEEPDLFLLEPNANYRLIRRDFFHSHRLCFPAGRLFEDPPVHLRMLALASRIGLIADFHYIYRVNRPGKITTQRGNTRFDALEVALESLQSMRGLNPPAAIGAVVLYSLIRAIWWCGGMTFPGQRHDFFSKASQIVRDNVPEDWLNDYWMLECPDSPSQRPVVDALMRADVQKLVGLSAGMA